MTSVNEFVLDVRAIDLGLQCWPYTDCSMNNGPSLFAGIKRLITAQWTCSFSWSICQLSL